MAILECRGLCKSFGKTQALSHVDLSVEAGRIVGLLGPNGSGKTTLIKLLNGLLIPDEGQILIDGHTPGKASHALVSYLPDHSAIPLWMNVRHLMNFYGDFFRDFDRKAAEEMFQRLGIPLKGRIKSMSKGTQEKVQLVVTMCRRARLYLLDEPIGGVDPATRDFVLNTIITHYNPQAAVILSTHLIADVERVLDDVIMLEHGHLLLQSPAEDLREERGMSIDALFREVYKC